MNRGIARPIEDRRGQLRGPPGLDDKSGFRFAKKARRLGVGRSHEDAGTPRRQHAIDLARNDQPAKIGAHRNQMGIGRGEAFGELPGGLGREETDIVDSPQPSRGFDFEATRPLTNEEKNDAPAAKRIRRVEHGVEIVCEPHVAGIDDNEFPFEPMLAAEGIVGTVERLNGWSPIRDDRDARIGNSPRGDPRGHAAADRHHGIGVFQGRGGKGAEQIGHCVGARQHTEFLGHLRIQILGPVDHPVALEKFQRKPGRRQHRRIGHRHHKIRARQKQRPRQQRGDHERIAERPQKHIAPGKEPAGADDANTAPGLGFRLAGFCGGHHDHLPSAQRKALRQAAEHIARRPLRGRIDTVDEKDRGHSVADGVGRLFYPRPDAVENPIAGNFHHFDRRPLVLLQAPTGRVPPSDA